MANKKITELNEASSITSSDWLVMVDTAKDETKKIHPDLVGASVPIQDTAPQDPEENDLWIDTSTPSSTLDFLNVFYPVGTYYETSNADFNPNTAWGGTWVEDSKGRVTVGQDTNDTSFDTIGETGGEKTHTLTTNEMPSHNHTIDNIDYGIANDNVLGGSYPRMALNGTVTSNSTGGGQAHNNLQPYIVVKRWHRTA